MKKRILCPTLPKLNHPSILSEAEAHHALRVLRLREGEKVEAMDGKGHKALATLRIKGVSPQLEWISEEEQSTSIPLPPAHPLALMPLLNLEMAVLKGPAMEWAVEKAVELGVHSFTPVLTDFTVVQMKSKGPEVFQERWQKIANQALKQCGRLDQMMIQSPLRLSELLAQTAPQVSTQESQERLDFRLWCDEKSIQKSPFILKGLEEIIHKKGTKNLTFRLLIGPEGGWSAAERDLLGQETHYSQTMRVHLGPLTLRAETAALFAVSAVSAHHYILN